MFITSTRDIPDGMRQVRLVKERMLGELVIELAGERIYMTAVEASGMNAALTAALALHQEKVDALIPEAQAEDAERELLADAEWRSARDTVEQTEPDYA